MNCKGLIIILLWTAITSLPATLCAQQKEQKTEQTAEEKARIAEQRKLIEQLEKEVAEEEKKLNSIKKDKSTAQQRVRSITRQINSRNQLLNKTEKEISSIEKNIQLNDSLLTKTRAQELSERERYAEMVREAYRNHQQNNYITYLLASENFSDAARRTANIRAVAELRAERMRRIDSLRPSSNSSRHSTAAVRTSTWYNARLRSSARSCRVT